MKIMKKFRPFDYLIILIIVIALIVGLMTIKGKRATSSNQIEATTNVEVEVFIKGATITGDVDVFKKGEETFITIRNVPYTKLKIKDAKYNRRKTVVPSLNSKKPYVITDDESAPNQYDYLVKVVDSAKITKEGDAVLGGNKVKIGLPIILEGPTYKLNGIISNITVNLEPESGNEELDKHTKLNQDVQ